jgi:hypothetical protein
LFSSTGKIFYQGVKEFQEKYSIEIWEFENLPNKKWKTEEVFYKGHFEKLSARSESGRYIMELP